MIQPDGQYAMLDEVEYEAALAAFRREDPPPGTLLVHGTEADVAAMAKRVRLGDAELTARRARRKAQRSARRRNRS